LSGVDQGCGRELSNKTTPSAPRLEPAALTFVTEDEGSTGEGETEDSYLFVLPAVGSSATRAVMKRADCPAADNRVERASLPGDRVAKITNGVGEHYSTRIPGRPLPCVLS
jgi:hypothetical protein